MKKILMLFLLLSIASCARIDGTNFGSFTTVGIEAGLPEGVTLVIGYRRAEIIRCETQADVDIGLNGLATATSLEGEQYVRFGNAARRATEQDITINDGR